MGTNGGKRAGAGRKKGSLGVRTRDLIAILDEHGYCPISQQIRIAALAEKEYQRAALIYDKIADARADENVRAPLNDSAPVYLQLMQKCASDIAPYLFPKRKAIEHALDAESVSTLAEMIKNASDAKRKTNPSS